MSQTLIFNATKALVHLRRLSRLAHLDLQDTAIGDAALRHVTQLRRLQSLNLRCTAVSDASLEHLAALKTLELLVLEGTHVTPQGIEKLHRSLPGTRIHTGKDSANYAVFSVSGLVASRVSRVGATAEVNKGTFYFSKCKNGVGAV